MLESEKLNNKRVNLTVTINPRTREILDYFGKKNDLPISRIIDMWANEKMESGHNQVLEGIEKEKEIAVLKEKYNREMVALHDEYRSKIMDLQEKVKLLD